MDNMEDKIVQLEKEITDERGRLSSDRMDISFGELINLYKSKELIIRPDYQRLFRWSPEQKTALIESILLSIPIPPIFVAEDKDGVWELVDGLQRVSTIVSFFGELESDVTKIPFIPQEVSDDDDTGEIETQEMTDLLGNRWALGAGGLVPNLESFTIDTLPNRLKINIKRAVCRVEILRGESSTEMKYHLFKRLNSGGSKATPQEIRNAVYRGLNPKISDLIVELSQNEIFKKLTALSKSKKSELYDQELILRFIAFYNRIDSVNENTEKYLNKFMDEACISDSLDLNSYKDTFEKVLSQLDELGDEKIFRNNNNLFVPAYFEGISVGLAQNSEKYLGNPQLLKVQIQKLKSDEEFKRVSGPSSNSRSRIKSRLSRANDIFLATEK